jgi:multiple sugar transport system substrate-binding protein
MHPDVFVDVLIVPHGQGDQRLIAAQAVGAPLDVVNEVNADFIEADYLLPLDDVIDEMGRDDFKPGSIYHFADHDYAIGYSGGTHGTLWVRTDLLEEAGLEPPTTYAELLAAAEAMTQDTDGDGKIDIWGIGLPAGSDGATMTRLKPFIYQNCGSWFDKEGNLTYDSPGVLEALERYIALVEYSPPDVTSWSWFGGIDAFTTGRIAMHPYGGRLGVNLWRQAPEIRENTSVIYFPVGDEVQAGRGAFDWVALSSTSAHPEEAKEFLKFFLSPEQLSKLLISVPGHLIPPTYSAAEYLAGMDHEYMAKYKSDVETLYAVADLNADPALNMGAVDVESCTFEPTVNPMPWMGACSPSVPIDSELIQRVVIEGESPEEAWQWAIEQWKTCSEEWKAEHPGWAP